MNILDIFLQFIVEHLQQLDILVVLSFIIIEIWIVFFPHKFNIPSDCMLFKPSFLFASFFKKIIAQRLLSKKILKELKVPVVPFSQRLSFDEFSEKYVRLYINGKQIIESVYEQIQKGKKRFIFAGGGGRGKTLTAYKLIDILKDEGYIPIIYRSDFDKDKILENSISLDTQTAKLLQNIFYKKFIFIFDNFDMETFTEASDSCLKEFPESLSVLTSRNASLNNDYNFNDVDKEKLLIGFLLRNQNIESDFTIPLYLAILKKLTSKDYKTKDEIVKQYIEKQNVLLKIRLHLADTMEEDFYQLLEYIYKSIALMAVKSIPIKNNKKFREDIVDALSEFDSNNRFEFIYQNLGLNELEFFNELERSSVLYEEKGVFKFIHDILAEYFQRLVANEMVENIDSYSNKQEKLNFITTLDSSNKKVYEELGLIYEKEEDYQKAVEHYYKSENYLKLEEIYSMNKVVISESNWYDLGGLFVKYNLYDQAIEAYQKA
ncbi:MAG: hypothetical protein KU29_09755, partial [Sulfurovum sp. FS06-10]